MAHMIVHNHQIGEQVQDSVFSLSCHRLSVPVQMSNWKDKPLKIICDTLNAILEVYSVSVCCLANVNS